MSPKYKLTYFPVKALGEPICYLLAYGEQDFENYRFERANWPDLKPKMPFGQVPVLEFDGKTAHQTVAICRYLANEYGLAGKDNWENYLIDCAVDCVNDLRLKLAQYWYESDEKLKEQKKVLIIDEVAPFLMGKLEELVKENNGYFVNGKLTWADLYFTGVADYMNMMGGGSLISNYPNLKSLTEKVMAVPAIKKWADANA